MRYIVLVLSLVACSATASPAEREGWAVIETSHAYQDLVDRVKTATKANKMGVVTEAGPTEAAANRGVTIPGNRVIGVYNNDFAVRMLEASEAAMIEAPIRFYVTEQEDGTATLSYKTPSLVFSPYAEDSPEVMIIAKELDVVFEKIAEDAVK
ncbi:MAG: DUF302 domain-containing protein [Marinobacter sp.]|uniref:DUF302 domain-containing protein n=1 Tax=Marinobacter sp. TaxID=50741 RepID=UPI001B6AD68C|nr:DUF302 domain-containing protein [Marinobacter sp.]MBQ0745885.1 DUF302 domain-containing protein [Marinobacter sp.]MBQ0814371.1 DUF302 domain-containing protein [Marinobacter sp.]|tara:strand:- start:367 stop:825 length:459 start_codon:yes stop_codon:yes gene_type:complete